MATDQVSGREHRTRRSSRAGCNCTAIKCAREREYPNASRQIYASLPATRLLLVHLLLQTTSFSCAGPFRPSAARLVRPPFSCPRREEGGKQKTEESDRRVSQSRRRWTRLCTLIKYYARLTERPEATRFPLFRRSSVRFCLSRVPFVPSENSPRCRVRLLGMCKDNGGRERSFIHAQVSLSDFPVRD